MSQKKLTRSEDKMMAGVMSGIAEYVNVDPVIIRVLGVLAILSNPPLGIIVYLLLAVIMPREGDAGTEGVAHPFSDEEIVIKDGS